MYREEKGKGKVVLFQNIPNGESLHSFDWDGGNDQQLFISTISLSVKCPRNNRTKALQKFNIFHCLSVGGGWRTKAVRHRSLY